MKKILDKKLPVTALKDPFDNLLAYSKKTTILLVITLIAILTLFIVGHYYDATTGFVPLATTVNVTGTTPTNCSISLQEGLNIVSFNCISNFQPRDELLDQTNTSTISVIYDYRPESQDRWRVYNPNLPEWVVQDLQHFSRLRGYLFYMDENTSIHFSGALAESSNIPLLEGMNLVGYPSVINDTLPDVLTTIQTTTTQVRGYDGQNDTWLFFDGTNQSTLTQLEPGAGYYIEVNHSTNWVVERNRLD